MSGSGEGTRARGSQAEREAARNARKVTQRAIRRLDILEWVIVFAGAALATLGGGLVAWVLASVAGWDFRSTWVGASLLLFVVSGTVTIVQIKREERADALRAADKRDTDDG